MEFQSMIDEHRSQTRFYRLALMALIAALVILSIVVPASIKRGPYIVQDSQGLYAVTRSEPWKLTVSRLEGFLKLYLTARFDWSKDTAPKRKDLLRKLVSEKAYASMKESVTSLSVLTSTQKGRVFFVLEGYRFANQKKLIEAKVSRIVRVGNAGVVTPLTIRLTYEEVTVSEDNPYGLQVKSVEEFESTTEENSG
jgi:hypothetical protein